MQYMQSECHLVKIFWLDLVSFSLYFQHRIDRNCLNPMPKFHHLKFHIELTVFVFETYKKKQQQIIIVRIPLVSAKLWCSPQVI